MSQKRRREQPSTDAALIEIFEDLAHEKEDIRLNAAQRLLSKFSLGNKPSSEEVQKLLKRLFRGLCSGRKAARLGFSVALTEILIQHVRTGSQGSSASMFSPGDVFEALKEHTKLTARASGQQERDHCFGKLFGSECLIKSEILFMTEQNKAVWLQILELILDLAKEKVWLREECGWVLCRALKILKDRPNGQAYAQPLIEQLHNYRTPEGVALWITARNSFPKLHMPKHVFRHQDPLDWKEKSFLARILVGSSTAQDKTNKDAPSALNQKGVWFSKPHFVWELALGEALKRQRNRVGFSDLWNEAVDDGLFRLSASEERKYWGFALFQLYAAALPKEQLASLFTKNFVRCLTNQLASKDRFLHAAAERSIKAILARAKGEPESVPMLFQSIIYFHPDFDTMTKSKTIETLLSSTDIQVQFTCVHVLEGALERPRTSDEKTASNTRRVVADYLMVIIRSCTFQDKSEKALSTVRSITMSILDLFAKHAFFMIEPGQALSPVPSIAETSRTVLRSRISSALGHLLAKDPDPSYHPCELLYRIQRRKDDKKLRAQATFSTDPEMQKTIRCSLRMLEKFHAKDKYKSRLGLETYRVFALLFSLTILQVYNGESDAADVLGDLLEVSKDILDADAHESHPEASQALVEIVLSFASKPSKLFRQLSQQVVKACSSMINADGLSSMLKVLETKETVAGLNELFDKEEEDADIDMAEAEEVEDLDAEAHSTEAEEDSVEDLTSDHEDAELAEFDAKLAQALNTRRADEDLAVSGEEPSDEDMDDEQMEALDKHIESMFRERKESSRGTRKEEKQAKETVVLFKCKVIELLEIYVKQQHQNPDALTLILPVLEAINATRSKDVSERCCSLIREFAKSIKLRPEESDELGTDELETIRFLLDEVHGLAGREGSNAYCDACSKASLLLVKKLLQYGGSIKEAIQRYATTDTNLMTDPECKVKDSFFLDWLNWRRSAREKLVMT